MATLTESGSDTPLTDSAHIREYLGRHGIWYRRFDGGDTLTDQATPDDVLAAYDAPIAELKTEGGYVTADVIDIQPDTPGLEAMLAKFDKEHWHDEDEVRFIVAGRGIFHIHPKDAPVFRIEVLAGDMINVPRGTLHWFHLCDERRIRAIRLFQDPAGWTPHYSDSGEDARHIPMCMGPSDFPRR